MTPAALAPVTPLQRWMRRATYMVQFFGGMVLALGGAWGLGFAWFNDVARRVAEPPGIADAIVVLTGGADRIEKALHLLADGRAPRLLVSGVARRADLGDVARRVPLDEDQVGRVTLDHIAQSTLGNAAETASWARTHDVKRLIVVTAGYHMPRALLELRHALPEVELHPVPVLSPALRGKPPATTIRMLASEFDKLLAVRIGLARLLRYGDAP